MTAYRFQPGQTVYILGRYRAEVIECGPQTVTCDVFEGLAPHEKTPTRANYRLDLVEITVRNKSVPE